MENYYKSFEEWFSNSCVIRDSQDGHRKSVLLLSRWGLSLTASSGWYMEGEWSFLVVARVWRCPQGHSDRGWILMQSVHLVGWGMPTCLWSYLNHMLLILGFLGTNLGLRLPLRIMSNICLQIYCIKWIKWAIPLRHAFICGISTVLMRTIIVINALIKNSQSWGCVHQYNSMNYLEYIKWFLNMVFLCTSFFPYII